MVARKEMPFVEAAAEWAKMTGTPRPHRGTMIRWATRGVRGVTLKARRFLGRWYTTSDALEDFLRRCEFAPPQQGVESPGPIRSARIEESLRKLDRKLNRSRSTGGAT